MALALYRKYRPATFADVVGQEHVTEPLRIALSSGRVNHAYLFSGPRGCGKTSSARILARSLNCVQGPTADPCGVCGSCVALAPEGPGNIDVIELDAASHGGVDDARELRDRAFYAPAESRYRVFIVDEAHMVTTQGFNALLKIVEEPPEHLVFVFATTEPDKVLPTIRSRTHHYPFRLIPPGTLRTLLERICADEGVTVAPAVYPLVIRAGGGSARDSLSILDQLIAGAGPDGVSYERAVALLGVTDVALIDDTVDALAAADGAAVFEAVDRLVEAGHDPRRFAADLLDRLRDLTLVNAVPDAAARGLVDAPGDQLERMTDQATRLGAATLSRYAGIVHAGLTEMRGATAPRLLLELLCGRMLLPAASTEDSALLERLERIERRADIASTPPPSEQTFQRPSRASGAEVDTPVPSSAPLASPAAAGAPSASPAPVNPAPAAVERVPAPPARSASQARSAPQAPRTPEAAPVAEAGPAAEIEPPAAVTPAPATAVPPPPASPAASEPAAPSGGGLDAADVRRAWPGILDRAKQASRSTGALLMNATVKAVEGDTLVLTIGAAPLAKRLSEQRNTEVIANALHAELGVRWRVRCDHDGGGRGGAAAAGPAAAASPPPRPIPSRPTPQSSRPDESRNSDERPAERSPESPAERPAESPAERPAASTPRGRPDDVPPPSEPPMDSEEEEYYTHQDGASSAAPPTPSGPDPQAAAMELLSSRLGARAMDDPRRR
ncbi:MAG TPA: DNA polymerase III subunit gamma and tau [Pseudonocardia sp.]|nr:DNA polymerase III subunit gamma and tau [Pseudonocardia sp.]